MRIDRFWLKISWQNEIKNKLLLGALLHSCSVSPASKTSFLADLFFTSGVNMWTLSHQICSFQWIHKGKNKCHLISIMLYEVWVTKNIVNTDEWRNGLVWIRITKENWQDGRKSLQCCFYKTCTLLQSQGKYR